MGLTEFAALFGIIFGLTGAVLGWLGYYRDKPQIVVTLQWDMSTINMPKYDSKKYWGLVTVTNIGKRPVYIQNAVLKLPKKYDAVLMLFDNATGTQKLGEGHPPIFYVIDQTRLTQYSKDWKKIIAEVKISSGKIFSSKKADKNKIPSWVKMEQ